jgi:transposase InsO family protein
VLPAPRVQDGLTISPSPFRKQADSKAPTDLIPDNGQVERMNRTIKDATVKRYPYQSHDQLVRHLADFLAAYNFARRLKTLNGLTPYEFVCKRWTTEPERFTLNPLQQTPGLNI